LTGNPEHRPRPREATPADLLTAAAWATTASECARWAGPDVSFPAEPDALVRQTEFHAGRNVALEDDDGLVAFGQVLPRAVGRVHLARVVVRPDARGRGVGRALVEALLARARESGASLVTLNVYRDNEAALALYADVGFRRSEQPGRDARSSPSVAMELRFDPMEDQPRVPPGSHVWAPGPASSAPEAADGDLEIRAARPEDAAAVTEVVLAAYGRYVERMGRRPAPMLDDYAAVIREHDVRVLADGERVAGALVLIPEGEGLLLDNVAVHPDYQGRGWGRRLLALAEEEARRAGATFIWLYTNEKMTEDIALYTSLGYVETERVTVRGYRRVHMRKEL